MFNQILKKFTVTVCVSAALLGPSTAEVASAWTGTVDQTTYDFSTVTGTVNDQLATLAATPWWGSVDLANSFAATVDANLGVNFDAAELGGTGGPLFVYSTDEAGNVYGVMRTDAGSTLYSFITPLSSTLTFATASPIGAPEIDGEKLPAAIFLLLAVLLVGYDRRNKVRSPLIPA